MTVYRQKFRSNSSEIRLECGALCRCIGRYPIVRVHKYAPCCGAQISLISFTRFRRRRRTSATVGYRRLPSATATLLIDDYGFATSIYFILNTPLLYYLSLILRTFTKKFANRWSWLLSDSHWIFIMRRHDSQQLWLQ